MKPVAKLRAVATVRCMLFAMKCTWSGRRSAFRSKRPRSPSRSRNQPPIAVSSAAPFRDSSPGADVQANHSFVVDSARFCFAVPRGERRLCRLTITTWRSSAAHPPAAATATKTHNSFFISILSPCQTIIPERSDLRNPWSNRSAVAGRLMRHMSADGNTENGDFTETGRLLWRICFAQNNNIIELIERFCHSVVGSETPK